MIGHLRGCPSSGLADHEYDQTSIMTIYDYKYEHEYNAYDHHEYDGHHIHSHHLGCLHIHGHLQSYFLDHEHDHGSDDHEYD